jgi:3-dehydroquinate dehydratase
VIILSVPYGSKKERLLQKIACNFDFIEYRLDYSKKLNTIDCSILSGKTILTIRDRKEGGKNAFSRQEKLKVYNNVIQETETLVDDEILHYLDELPSIDAERLILSWHAMNDENA